MVSSVVVKAELQTTSKRYMLHNLEASPIASMPPEGSDDAVLQRVICDEGVHILVCTASYLTASMGRRSFRKFFKFNVSQPFSLSHRQLQCPSGGGGQPGDVLIETELENNTPAVLCVTSVRLVCNEILFGLVAEDSHPSLTVVYVPPSCCAQFVHRLNLCELPIRERIRLLNQRWAIWSCRGRVDGAKLEPFSLLRLCICLLPEILWKPSWLLRFLR